MLVDGLNILTQLDVHGFVGMFWYALVLEVPRFSLGLVVAAGCSLFKRWRPAAPIPRSTRISVLLPGHNEGSALRRSVTALREQSQRDLQIVVVDDGSADQMAEIGRQLKAQGLIDVFVSTGLRGGKSAATNLGFTFCTGDLIVVGDIDTSLDRFAIERVIEPFCDPLVGCVSGNIGVRNYRASIIAKFQAIEYLLTISLGRHLSDLLGVVLIASGAFAAFRRDALTVVGGWDVGPGEDANMTLKLRRAGWKVRFAPEAWALTDVPETVSALFKQRRRWNASFVRVRLVRFKGMLNPFDRNFSLLNALGTLDLIFFQFVLPAMFFVYLISLVVYYASFFWAILAVVNAFYITTTSLFFVCAVATAGRYGYISLAPYVIGYALFRAYIMRMVTLWTYLDECSTVLPGYVCADQGAEQETVIMRLRRRPRFDNLQNEVRKRERSWGRWVYLSLVLALVCWVFDSFFGNYIYLRAEGLVLRERVVLATQYPAAIVELHVREGWNVKKGELLARLRSQSVEESLAKLHAQLAGVITRATELSIRNKVNEALFPLAQHRYEIARNARISSEGLLAQKLLAANRHSELVKDEVLSAESQAQLAAERDVIVREAADVRAAIDSSRNAIGRLNELYGDGVINSPVSGIVGYLEVSEGSVVREAEPVMEIFTGPPFVLAYVPEGALYDVQEGDHISIAVGLATYYGYVSQTYDLAGQLPKEFQQTFQPRTRARLIRVEFDPDQRNPPPLFAKTKLSAAGWPPDWLRRIISPYLPVSTTEPLVRATPS